MSQPDLLILVSALLGSSVIATAIQLISSRLRADRRSEILVAWSKELDLAEKLEKDAATDSAESGIAVSKEHRATRIAFSTAIRSDLTRRISNQLVPAASTTMFLFALLGSAFCMLSVYLFAFLGTTGQLASPKAVALLISTAFGVGLIVVALSIDIATNRLRGKLARTLDSSIHSSEVYSSSRISRIDRLLIPDTVLRNASSAIHQIESHCS